MEKMQIIQIAGGALAVALSIPTFMAGNALMGGILVAIGGIIIFLNVSKKD